MRYGILFSGVLALALWAPAVAGAGQAAGDTDSRYQRTVDALRTAPAPLASDFAGTALMQLAEAYMAEADLARAESLDRGGNAKLSGWSRAVDQYASQLLLVMEDVEEGFPVELPPGRDGGAIIAVAGRLVILSHPRAEQQSAFEQRVLQDFCSRHDCQALTADSVEREPIPVSAGLVRPDWTFSAQGPLCSHRGIQLSFSSAANLARARDICSRLLQEALTLGNEIAWQRRHGVTVDWDALEVRATPRRPEHLVQLNRSGDVILATLPLIHGSPGLLADLRPWLQNRFSGEEPVTLPLRAADYGWE